MSPILLTLANIFIYISYLSIVTAQQGPKNWTVSPFNAPALPLAVRSPYLNIWLAQGNDPQELGNIDPQLWPMSKLMGWYASATIDNQTYRLIGTDPSNPAANITSIEFTPTRTSFVADAGPMQFNISFISPIEPTDFVRQSIPFSYISISASSNDGNAHTLRIFSSITGELFAGDTTQVAEWSADDTDPYIVLSMQLQTQQKYTEVSNYAQDSTGYYALKYVDQATSSWAITDSITNGRNGGNMNRTLGNASDTAPRPIDQDWPTLGIELDWGSVESTPEPAVWAVGVMRSPSIQYLTASRSIEERYPYFISSYTDGRTAAKAFLDDFSRAQSVAQAFDTQISATASLYSSDYADLLALTTRQAMASLDITIAKSESGGWNMSDVKVFMKNMGGAGTDSAGQSQSVNTVDVLYAAFPMFLYLNPELGGRLLLPLFEYQDSEAYTLSYAAMNIGSSYPNATAVGSSSSHLYGIEESSNMLIMTLAYSQRSGNGTFLSKHYTLLRGWADYLVNDSLTPTDQISADFTLSSGAPSSNQTNLALKGIIGIACMAEIARIAGVNSDQERFNNTATSYISQWMSSAVAPDKSHVDFLYGLADTSGLIYNLYSDKLLQLKLVPDSIYELVSTFYQNTAGQTTFGLELYNGQSEWTTANGMIFAASTATDNSTRDSLISLIHNYASSSQNSTPFATIYNSQTGEPALGMNAGINSPASGAMFSLLALDTTIRTSINLPSDGSTIPNGIPSSLNRSPVNVGAVVGGIIGGMAAIIGLCVCSFCYLRQRRELHENAIIPFYYRFFDERPSGSSTTLQVSLPSISGLLGSSDGRKKQHFDHKREKSDTPLTLVDAVVENPPQVSRPPNGNGHLRLSLREDVYNLRRDLERLRQGLTDDILPPSYSEPTAV